MSAPEVPVVVYATGGHGRVVADALRAAHHELLGFVDDDSARHGTTVWGLPVVGLDGVRQLGRDRPLEIALGIGDNAARRASYERCIALGLVVSSVIHPSAIIAPSATVGVASVVLAGAIVNAEARIGNGCIVNTGAIVEHNVEVGDFAHVSPGATLAGGSRLGAESHLGAHAVVVDDIFVGARTVVGAGAVVNRPIPDDVVAYGVPARVRRPRNGRTP